MNPEVALQHLTSGSVVSVLAVCLVFVTGAAIVFYRRSNYLSDKMFQREVENGESRARMQHETNLALSAVAEAVRSRK